MGGGTRSRRKCHQNQKARRHQSNETESINSRALIITHFHETAMGWDGQSIFHKKQRLFIAPVISLYGHSSSLKMRS